MHELYKRLIEDIKKDPSIASANSRFDSILRAASHYANEAEKAELKAVMDEAVKSNILAEYCRALLEGEPETLEEMYDRHGFGSVPIKGEGQAVSWGWENIKDPKATMKYNAKERYRI